VAERTTQARLRNAMRETAEKIRKPTWWRPLAVMTAIAVIFAIALPVVLLVNTGLFKGFAEELSPQRANSIFALFYPR
jgi:hypothetical protein